MLDNHAALCSLYTCNQNNYFTSTPFPNRDAVSLPGRNTGNESWEMHLNIVSLTTTNRNTVNPVVV
jgi:hypothetical protein